MKERIHDEGCRKQPGLLWRVSMSGKSVYMEEESLYFALLSMLSVTFPRSEDESVIEWRGDLDILEQYTLLYIWIDLSNP